VLPERVGVRVYEGGLNHAERGDTLPLGGGTTIN
jgi:hypothetical protein